MLIRSILAISQVSQLLLVCDVLPVWGKEATKDTKVVDDKPGLLTESDSTEELAKKKIAPLLEKVQDISVKDIEFIVQRSYWNLAEEIVASSHKQGPDTLKKLSIQIRKAVKDNQGRGDELIRHLNPKYHTAQKVVPVYRWAQNETSILLTIKYSVKWDAPGAVNVDNPAVKIEGNKFTFSATGAHSGNKYEYGLNLETFDGIDIAESSWSSSSVGRFTATLAKVRATKWPRLLLDKKKKGTGRLDLTRQEELDKEISNIPVVSHSELSCLQSKKVYCPSKDSCKDDCTSCPNRSMKKENYCSGPPEKPVKSVVFTDTDMKKQSVGGELVITQDMYEYDISAYVVKVGKTKISEKDRTDEGLALLKEVPADRRNKEIRIELTNLPIKDITVASDEQLSIVVYSKNEFGQLEKPIYEEYKDAYLPESGPTSVSFHDTNGDLGKISGDISITGLDDSTVDEYVVYWGKKSGRKISTDPLLATVRRVPGPDIATIHNVSDKKIPSGATHFLVFAKNSFGETQTHFAITTIQDNTKPCIGKDKVNCPPPIKDASEDTNLEKNLITVNVSLEKKPTFAKDASIVLYLSTGKESTGASNYRKIENYDEETASNGNYLLKLQDQVVNPEGESWRYTHLLLYMQNPFGESTKCTSVPFTDLPGKTEDEEL